CFYTEAVAFIQGVTPDAMHVLLGIGERRTLRYEDFAAYYRRVRAGFLAALASGASAEPYRCEHCTLCEFRAVSEERVQREDHLLRVAGIRGGQVNALRSAGTATLKQLAEPPPTPELSIPPRPYETLRDQAGLQLHRRTTGALTWHELPIEPGCGF